MKLPLERCQTSLSDDALGIHLVDWTNESNINSRKVECDLIAEESMTARCQMMQFWLIDSLSRRMKLASFEGAILPRAENHGCLFWTKPPGASLAQRPFLHGR